MVPRNSIVGLFLLLAPTDKVEVVVNGSGVAYVAGSSPPPRYVRRAPLAVFFFYREKGSAVTSVVNSGRILDPTCKNNHEVGTYVTGLYF